MMRSNNDGKGDAMNISGYEGRSKRFRVETYRFTKFRVNRGGVFRTSKLYNKRNNRNSRFLNFVFKRSFCWNRSRAERIFGDHSWEVRHYISYRFLSCSKCGQNYESDFIPCDQMIMKKALG